MLLRTLYPDPFYDEERYYLYAGLADIHFARSMLRRVGEAERRRFDEAGFAYGDSSMMGYSPYEVYDEQLANVLYTLFGDGYAGDLMSVAFYDEDERGIFEGISALDGGPVKMDDTDMPFGGDFEEALIVEIRAFETERTTEPGSGPTARQKLDALTTALRAAAGEAGGPALYRWRSDSQAVRHLRETGSSTDALLLIYSAEPMLLQEVVHGAVFERFIAAYRHWPEHLMPRAGRQTQGNSETR